MLRANARCSTPIRILTSLSPSPARWPGGPGRGPSVAQGLQHRLRGLRQGRGGGRRGAPLGGGRPEQPPHTTVLRRQITREERGGKKSGEEQSETRRREPLPPTASIAPMSPAVIIFYFCILFIAFYMKRKLICRSDFFGVYICCSFFFFYLHQSQNLLSFLFFSFARPPPPSHQTLFFKIIFAFQKQASAKRDFMLANFIFFLKEKTKSQACSFLVFLFFLVRRPAGYLNSGGPRRRPLVTALSWCHISRPHSPQAWPPHPHTL